MADGNHTPETTVPSANDISLARARHATRAKRAARTARPSRAEKPETVALDHAGEARRRLVAAFGPMLLAAGDEVCDD